MKNMDLKMMNQEKQVQRTMEVEVIIVILQEMYLG